MELQRFVVGNAGLAGPQIVIEGTDHFAIANNDAHEHRIDIVRLPSGRMTLAAVAASLRDGRWPPPKVKVLDHGPALSPMEMSQVRLTPLRPGYYALVDVADDLRTGNPYALQRPFVWAFSVIEGAP